MAYTHKIITTAQTPEGNLSDAGVTYTGTTTQSVIVTVDAVGGSVKAVNIDFTAALLKSIVMLSTVPVVVTLTGVTVIDGVTAGTVSLLANEMRTIKTVTGSCTGMSVAASSGADAGTITISVLSDSE